MKADHTLLSDLLPIKFPILLAPMYMVSNQEMTIEAMNAGIAACIPANNWETIEEMSSAIQFIKKNTKQGALGINLWFKYSHQLLNEQIEVCKNEKVDYIYTSISNPEEIIKAFQNTNIKIFCSVKTEKQALKVQELGADAIIYSRAEMSKLSDLINIPVIAEGEISSGSTIYNSIHKDKSAGCSIGSLFIASEESGACERYKKACISSNAKDIVITEREMPFPISVLNTTYICRHGKSKSIWHQILNRISFLQNYFNNKKFEKGLDLIKKATKDDFHKKLWLGSKSIQQIKSKQSTKNIINTLISTYTQIEKQKLIMSRSISRET